MPLERNENVTFSSMQQSALYELIQVVVQQMQPVILPLPFLFLNLRMRKASIREYTSYCIDFRGPILFGMKHF